MASDHQYITFDVAERTTATRTRIRPSLRWKMKKLDVQKLAEERAIAPDPIAIVTQDLTGRQMAKRLADETTELTKRLCNSTLPKRKHRETRPSQYWWTDEIAELWRRCLLRRRRATRDGGRPDRRPLQDAYRTERKKLTNAIRDSKTGKSAGRSLTRRWTRTREESVTR